MFRACELKDQTYKKTRTLHFLRMIQARQVTDLDVTDLGFSGPRIPVCATAALWERVTPFSRSLFFSEHLSSVLGRNFVTRSGIPAPKRPNHPQRKPPFQRMKTQRRRDDNKSKTCVLGGGALGQRGKSSKNAVFRGETP